MAPIDVDSQKPLDVEGDTEGMDDPSAHTIVIPRRHHLFGLWEGSFKVSNPKGADEDISETFFICSFHGERDAEDLLNNAPDTLPEPFSELPPDPRVCLFLALLQFCSGQ